MSKGDYDEAHPSALAFQEAERQLCPGMSRITVALDPPCVENDYDFAMALEESRADPRCRERYAEEVVQRWRELLAVTCPNAIVVVSRAPWWRGYLTTCDLAYDLTDEEKWICIFQTIDFGAWERMNLEAYSAALGRSPEENSPEVCGALGKACSRLLNRLARLS